MVKEIGCQVYNQGEDLSHQSHNSNELEKSNHMLTDKDIFGASCLLKKAFPGISGLEDTVIAQNFSLVL